MTDTSAFPKCAACGHWVPPEDPTDDQVEEFLDSEANDECGECSYLWLVFMLKIFDDVKAGR